MQQDWDGPYVIVKLLNDVVSNPKTQWLIQSCIRGLAAPRNGDHNFDHKLDKDPNLKEGVVLCLGLSRKCHLSRSVKKDREGLRKIR